MRFMYTHYLTLLARILATTFVLIVVARWFHPALFDVEVTYWLAGLTALAAVTAVFLNKKTSNE